eukprot:360202-Chlamydomonas_euryale.AAC.4
MLAFGRAGQACGVKRRRQMLRRANKGKTGLPANLKRLDVWHGVVLAVAGLAKCVQAVLVCGHCPGRLVDGLQLNAMQLIAI